MTIKLDEGFKLAVEVGNDLFTTLYVDLGLDPGDALRGLAIAAVAIAHKTDNPDQAMDEFVSMIEADTLKEAVEYLAGWEEE